MPHRHYQPVVKTRHGGFPMAEISSTIGGLEVSGETMTGGLVGEGFNIWPFFCNWKNEHVKIKI